MLLADRNGLLTSGRRTARAAKPIIVTCFHPEGDWEVPSGILKTSDTLGLPLDNFARIEEGRLILKRDDKLERSTHADRLQGGMPGYV